MKRFARVKWFNNEKGYGFLLNDEGVDVFVHYKSILEQEGYKTLQEGQLVEYTESKTERGLSAHEVVVQS